MNHTISFEVLNGVQWLSCRFDTEWPGKNLLQDVIYDGFYLDTGELPASHPVLYKTIKLRMEHEAHIFWRITKEERKELFDRMPDISPNDIVDSFFSTIKSFKP